MMQLKMSCSEINFKIRRNEMYSFSKDNLTVLKENVEFFTSPIANHCMAPLFVGLVMPKKNKPFNKDDSVFPGYVAPYWGSATTEVIVAGGNCCDGYIIAVSDKGKITAILAIDFNIRQIVPIVYRVPKQGSENAEEDVIIGLLVSGAGCSGKGVRFVDFNRVTPTSTPVVATEEEVRSYDSWLYGANPLKVDDIWERLEKIGVKADKELTEKAVAAFSTFRSSR